MTNEYAEELYAKFSKDISKKERNGLKRSFQACDNSKYQVLKNLVLQKKNPLKSFNGLCVFIAMGMGGAFLLLNAVLCGVLMPLNKINYDVFLMIMLVFDCILGVILFCYYAAYLPIHAMEANKQNLQAINNIINN